MSGGSCTQSKRTCNSRIHWQLKVCFLICIFDYDEAVSSFRNGPAHAT